MGFAARKQITEHVDLYANSYFSQAEGRNDYFRHNLGLAYDTKKRISAYAAGTYFDKSPYHLPDRHWGVEGGIACRLNEKSAIGIVSVCTLNEQQGYFGYYKRQISPSMVLTGFAGYRTYDQDFRSAMNMRDSVEIGLSIEFMKRMTPFFHGLLK